MNRNQRQVRTNIQPVAGCHHPSCQAHNAHVTAQQAAGLVHNHVSPAVPQPAAQGRSWGFTANKKNWIIGILIFFILAGGSALSDKDKEIADLKAKVSHSHSVPAKTTKLSVSDVIKLCKAISAKGDYAQCVTETLAQQGN